METISPIFASLHHFSLLIPLSSTNTHTHTPSHTPSHTHTHKITHTQNHTHTKSHTHSCTKSHTQSHRHKKPTYLQMLFRHLYVHAPENQFWFCIWDQLNKKKIGFNCQDQLRLSFLDCRECWECLDCWDLVFERVEIDTFGQK